MLIVVGIYCCYYLMPEDLVSFGKTAALSMLGVSNFYFYIHTNYFESSSSEPLLHTVTGSRGAILYFLAINTNGGIQNKKSKHQSCFVFSTFYYVSRPFMVLRASG